MLDRRRLYHNHFVIDSRVAKRAVEAYLSGASSTVVGASLGISSKTVLDYVRRAGGVVRPRRKYESLSDDQKISVERAYADGCTLEDVAGRHGVCLSTVRKHLKARGLTIGISESNKRRRGDGEERCLTRVLGAYARSAKKRGISFQLTRDQMRELVFGACRYCGRSGVNKGRKNNPIPYNGIDRVDNVVGYKISNVVTCCVDCNRAKSDMSMESFYSWVDLVHERKQGGGV